MIGLIAAADQAKQPTVEQHPFVSAIIPVYNARHTLGGAVASLLRQTYANIEVIVIDDGSTDESASVAEKVGDLRVRVIRRPHEGVVATRNAGCRLAQGKYIACLDADDLAHKQRIEKQVHYLEEHSRVGLLGTWATIEEEREPIWTFRPPVDDSQLRRYLLWDNPFIQSSVMLPRSAFLAAGGYQEGPIEDYRLWVRIAQRWNIAILPEPLVTYRVRPETLSHRGTRTTHLWQRLAVQWEAAQSLGPWHAALPALVVTSCGWVASVIGGRVEKRLRALVRASPIRRPNSSPESRK